MKYKLIAFDMDGVIFEHFNFWLELHKKLGTYKDGKKLTEKYLKDNYEKLVDEVVHKLWKGKSAIPYFKLIKEAEYLPRVKETFSKLKKLGIKTAIISSGPKDLALRAKKELGIDFIFTNELVLKKNEIIDFKWPIGHGEMEKINVLKRLCNELNINLNEVAYVGDHDNDIGVFKIVGLAIAFNSKSKQLNGVADSVINKIDLREILKYVK